MPLLKPFSKYPLTTRMHGSDSPAIGYSYHENALTFKTPLTSGTAFHSMSFWHSRSALAATKASAQHLLPGNPINRDEDQSEDNGLR